MKVSPKILIILAVLFWSGNFFLGKIIVQVIPPMSLAFLRWFLAFIFLFAFYHKKIIGSYQEMKKNRLLFFVLGGTGMMGFNVFVYLAVKYTTAINATIINASTPMLTAVLAILLLKEKLNLKQGAGIALSFLGVVWIIIKGNFAILQTMSFNPGDLVMLLAVVFNAGYFLILKLKGGTINPIVLFAGSILGGLAAGVPLFIIESSIESFSWLADLGFIHYLILIYLGIFPTILSFLFFNKAVLEIGPVKASIYLNLQIVFTSILGMTFLNEKLFIFHLVGGILIVIGVWLTNKKKYS
ncbi:MAG: DMT family transporter [Bacillota bacterium]